MEIRLGNKKLLYSFQKDDFFKLFLLSYLTDSNKQSGLQNIRIINWGFVRAIAKNQLSMLDNNQSEAIPMKLASAVSNLTA